MKKLYTIIFTFAALLFAFASCTEEEAHKPGEPDVAGCYGVYFPAQADNLSLDPADPTVATITVARNNTSGAITVPYSITGSTDIVKASEITFADGQSETTCNLTFDAAEVGVSYSVHFVITDEQYASKYGSLPIAFDYTVMRDKWNSLGTASFLDTWMFAKAYPAELIQNDKDKNLYRLIDPLSEGLKAEGYYPDYYKAGPSEYIEFRVLQKGQTLAGQTIATSDLVYFKTFFTGYFHNGYSAEVKEYHPASFTKYPDESGWLYNKVLQYQENGLPAGIQLAPFVYMDGVGGWDNSQKDGQTIIIFPGAKLTDYSIELEAGLSDDGELPVDFTLGTDVAVAKYAVYEGNLNAAQIEKRVGEITDGTEKNAKSISESGVVNVTMDATGVYTLIAVTFDAEKNAQENESVSFSYVAKGDKVPVVISCGLNLTDKYAVEGYTSENSLEWYSYGEDITEAKVGIFNHLDVLSKPKEVVAALLEATSLGADDLAALNGNGVSAVIGKLSPGTPYDLLVWATNGYEQKIVTASATTNGDPLPIYMKYSVDDIDLGFSPEHRDGLYGKYNFYATDVSGDLGVRENLGTIEVKESSIPTTGPDKDGLYDEYVTVSGMFADAAEKWGFNDDQTFNYYGGVIYTVKNSFGKCSEDDYYAKVLYGGNQWGYDYDYLLVGGFVSEGHIAFVCAPGNESYGFNGIGVMLYSDAAYQSARGWVAKFVDPMFVNPDNDVSGAPATVRNSALQQIYNEYSHISNFVQTPKARMRSIIDRVNGSVALQGVQANVETSIELPSVSFDATYTPSPSTDRKPAARTAVNPLIFK